MKLDNFLRVKQARCVVGYDGHLTAGKTYPVLGLSVPNNLVKVENDNGFITEYDFGRFEPVLDQVENPLQDMKLTPEFEAVPKFKVGDPVYFPRLSNKLCVIGEGQEDDYVDEVNGSKALAEMQSDLDFVYDQKTKSWLWDEKDCAPQLLYATPENYALLTQLYPHIEFEQPPKPLSGDELVRQMILLGIKNVLCFKNGTTDKVIIDRLCYEGSLMTPDCVVIGGVTPIDWYTGEPLTQAVLDE